MSGFPRVSIVGRPNTGKSTLFNLIAGHRIAIMHETPGVTRDPVRTVVAYRDRSFELVDSGGLFNDTDDDLNRLVHDRSLLEAFSSEIILFLCDINGPTPVDEEIIRVIRRKGRLPRVVLVLNKADSMDRKDYADRTLEFLRFGAGDPMLVSAAHNLGVQDLLDLVISRLPPETVTEGDKPPPEPTVQVCLIGKPNSGKSTLLNRLAGKDLSIVHDRPGTTRDPVDTEIRYHGHVIRVIDTAGIRKKAKVTESVEYYSVNRAINNIRNSDITVLLIDPLEGLNEQEKKIIHLAAEAHKGLIVCVNKWDLVDKKKVSFEEYVRYVRKQVPYLDFIPVVSLSALTGLRAHALFEHVLKVFSNYNKRVETAVFNRFLKSIQPGGRLSLKAKIYYGLQVRTSPPVFQLFVNREENVPESRRAFIQRRIQEEFDFTGVFVTIQYKTSKGGGKK